MIFSKLTKSIFVIVLVLVCSQAAWAANLDFKVQLRILDMTLSQIDGKPRVTHMVAEVVNITEPAGLENSGDNQLKESFAFIQKNAKQINVLVTPEAEREGKLLGFFHPFVNGIHKVGVFKASSTIRAFRIDGLDGWQFLLTECYLMEK